MWRMAPVLSGQRSTVNGQRTHVFPRSPLVPRSAPPRRRPRRRRRAGRCRPGGRGDPSPRDRGRRAGAALHERQRRVVPARHEPVRHGAARRAGVRRRGRSRSSSGSCTSPRRSCRRRRPSCGARATSRGELLAGRRDARRTSGRSPRSSTSDVRLDRLPVITCWPEDGGPFVTLPLVYTEHPGRQGATTSACTGCRSTTRAPPACTGRSARAAASTTQVAEARGQALPVTVFLGGPPALILAAIAPLPENVPELMLASLIAGRAAAARRTGRGPHPLVADAEFALIGEVPPRVRRPEGPFGDHYGYYSLQHDYPVFHVRADRAPARRDLSRRPSSASRGRRTSSSATCCRSCCRRCSRW